MMVCAVCFDVKKEDAELEEGHKGIGGCVYYQDDMYYDDANLFGSIEAQGSDSFRFAPDNKNDWDIDGSGWLDDYSYSEFYGDGGYFWFVSEPLDVNANSGKNLGIRKEATYLKCYIGQTDSLDSGDIFEKDISLSDFTTDKPRRADLSCIEDAASRLFAGISLLIALIA